jgi:hypothetical protein
MSEGKTSGFDNSQRANIRFRNRMRNLHNSEDNTFSEQKLCNSAVNQRVCYLSVFIVGPTFYVKSNGFLKTVIQKVDPTLKIVRI